MYDFFRIAVVMEMLVVNLFIVDICSSRKYSRFTCYAALFCFTFVLTAFTKDIWKYIGFDEGNAVFSMIGIVYLIPLALLYRESLHHLLSVLFSAWIYTMFIYCLSVRVAGLWPEQRFLQNAFLIQSLFYAMTLYSFLHWVRKGFLFVISNIAKSSRHILQLVSLCWFFSIIIVQANLIYTDSNMLKMASILILSLDSVFSYLLIFSMVTNQKEIRNLEQIVFVDDLTKLCNRARLFKDLPSLIEEGKPFRLLFMDLDRFKSINDQYGHAIGDQYLICFSRYMSGLLRPGERLYRMSGDEFVITTPCQHCQELIERLHSFPDALDGMDIPFLGLSLGWADFPEEQTSPDKLISLADHRMYQSKPVTAREMAR